jgi:probable O-glycosylation ligase (exosortase A-associated)
MACLWLWFTVTSNVAGHSALFAHHSADTWARWTIVSKVMVMAVVTVMVVNSFVRLRILLIVTAGSLGFYVAKSLPFMILTGGAQRLYGPEQSMIADNNDFGLALNMTLPLFLLLARTEHKRWVRWLFGILYAITVPAIFFTYSRGALLGLVVNLGFMMLHRKMRLFILPVMLLGLVLAVSFAPAAWKQRMDPTRSEALDASAQQRLKSWNFCWKLALESPLTGGGFATFTPTLYRRLTPDNPLALGPHSVYFGLIAEHGFVGGAVYAALLIACFARTRNVLSRARQRGDRAAVDYAAMLRQSLIGFLVCGAFLGRAYFDYFFTIVAAIAILGHVARDAWVAEDTTAELAGDPEAEEAHA